MARVNNIDYIAFSLIKKIIISLITRLLNNWTLRKTVEEDNKVDKNGGSKTIKD